MILVNENRLLFLFSTSLFSNFGRITLKLMKKDTASAEYLFVYGSLRTESQHPMAKLLNQKGESLGEAYVWGRLYLISWYPALVSSPYGMRVLGELFRINDEPGFWKLFDEYEGYDPANEAESLFVRRRLPVLRGSKERLAWLYIYNQPIDGMKIIESGDFLHP